MDESIWWFERRGERLCIGRRRAGSRMMLVVCDRAGAKRYEFTDVAALERFQLEIEVLLLSQQWNFLEFVPDGARVA